MAAKTKPEKTKSSESLMVWERPEPATRPAPRPLSRERIVRAAIALADKDGLAAVSLRNVGAALDAGAMRLYGYLSTKEELLELMADAVYGEMATGKRLTGDWRRVLRAIAHRIRSATRQHPWFVELLGGRPHLGPRALEQLEAWFAALARAPGFEEIDTVLRALKTVTAFVIGAIRGEASDLRPELALDQDEWQKVTGPYIQRMIATGRFPQIARVVHDAKHLSADAFFDHGLERVLDGLGAAHAP